MKSVRETNFQVLTLKCILFFERRSTIRSVSDGTVLITWTLSGETLDLSIVKIEL